MRKEEGIETGESSKKDDGGVLNVGHKQRRLTQKQKLFVAEYQKDWNATRAAAKAGYSPNRPDRAGEIGYQLLQKTLIKETLARDIADRLRRVGVQADKVLTRMARIGYVDIRKLYGPNNTLLDVKDWPSDIVPAVAGVEVFEEYQGRGEDRILIGYTKKVRLWDPNPSLTNMAKNLGVIGNGKHRDDEEDEKMGRTLTTLELSAKIVYLVKLAVERKRIERESVPAGDTRE